jgi:hypothetical protein
MSDSDATPAPTPILFILGPSGAGKSTLAAWAAADLGFLHLEIDVSLEEDGIDREGLRTEWLAFWRDGNAAPLTDALLARARMGGSSGIILSFPSVVVPSSRHVAAATRAGISMLVLYGPKECCFSAFLERERASGRGLGLDHWVLNNEQQYADFGAPEFAPFRASAFEGDRFRTRSLLVAEVERRAGNSGVEPERRAAVRSRF